MDRRESGWDVIFRSIVIRLFGEGFWRLGLDVATIVNVIIFEGVYVLR